MPWNKTKSQPRSVMDLMVVTKLQWHNTEIYLYNDRWEAGALDQIMANPMY